MSADSETSPLQARANISSFLHKYEDGSPRPGPGDGKHLRLWAMSDSAQLFFMQQLQTSCGCQKLCGQTSNQSLVTLDGGTVCETRSPSGNAKAVEDGKHRTPTPDRGGRARQHVVATFRRRRISTRGSGNTFYVGFATVLRASVRRFESCLLEYTMQ